WLAVVGFINSAISLYYYMNIARLMFFVEGETTLPKRPAGLTFVIWVSLVATLVLIVFPGPLLEIARHAGEFIGVQ
ncbi:MAG: NADH-quinone oxidoreductase subunit N, partial [Armatimonadia bacterium]